MRAIKERLRPHLDKNPIALKLEKWLQIHAGKHPAIYFNLYRLLRTRENFERVVTPDTQLVIEGFPRSGNYVCQEGLCYGAGRERSTKRASPIIFTFRRRWFGRHDGRYPPWCLYESPEMPYCPLPLWDPISVDQALKYYISFYETVEKYRDAYVLGLFEEVTEDFGQVIKRINDKFGTTFSLFRHDEENVSKVFADMETYARKCMARRYGSARFIAPPPSRRE